MKKLLFTLCAFLCTLSGFALENTFLVNTAPEWTGTQINPYNDQPVTLDNGNFVLKGLQGSAATACKLKSSQLYVYIGGSFVLTPKDGVTINSAAIISQGKEFAMTITDNVATLEVTTDNAKLSNTTNINASSVKINYEEAAQAVEISSTYPVADAPEYKNAEWNGTSTLTNWATPLTFADGDLVVTSTNGSTNTKLRTGNGGMLQVYPGGSYILTPAEGVTLVSAKIHVANPSAQDRDMTITDNVAKYDVADSYIGVSQFIVTYTKAGEQKQQCAEPQFSLAANESYNLYPFHTAVTLTCETPDAEIHYTLNKGEEQIAPADGIIYLNSSATVEAWATREGWVASNKVKRTYYIQSANELTYTLTAADGDVTRVDLARGVWVEFNPAATCENNQFTVPANGVVYLYAAEGLLFGQATINGQAMYIEPNLRIAELIVEQPLTFSQIAVKQYGKAQSAAKSQEFTGYQIAEAGRPTPATQTDATTFTIKLDNDNQYTTTLEGFTFVLAKGSGSSSPAYNKAGDLRIYANNTLTVTAPDELEKIDFYISTQGKKQMGSLTASNGFISPNQWLNSADNSLQQPVDGIYTWECQPTQLSNTVTFTVPAKGNLGTAKNADGSYKAAQLDFDKIVIYYNELVTRIGDVTVDNDANAPVEYYNLQGVRVQNPENGIFIRVQGKKVTKVIK